MKYSFHPETEAEFLYAIDYYEEKVIGLGLEFALEVYSTIERILFTHRLGQILKEI